MAQYNHQNCTLHVPIINEDGDAAAIQATAGGGSAGTASSAAVAASPIALYEIAAINRVFPALGQTQMLSFLRLALLHVPTSARAGGARKGKGTTAALEATEYRLTPVGLLEADAGTDVMEELDIWILAYLDNNSLRLRYIRHVVSGAREFAYADSEVLMAIGDLYTPNVK